MNERMIELYKEASEFAYEICQEEGRTGGTGDHIWNTLSTGKFAELIVLECLKTCTDVENEALQNHEYKAGSVATLIKVLIKEHFGVEE